MSSQESYSHADIVDRLLTGYVTKERADEIVACHPEVPELLVGWIRESAEAGNLRRVERFSNLAAKLDPPGFGEVLRELLDQDIPGLNFEDLVDIAGEIRAMAAADSIFRVVQRRIESDAPAYWLTQKAVLALSELATSDAESYLRQLVTEVWPNAVRWHAAVALGIEDDLAFDEDVMLGGE